MRIPGTVRGGFTIIEIIIAIGIFVVLAGGIIACVATATSASSETAYSVVEMRRVDAFLEFCRDGFIHAGGERNLRVSTRAVGGSGRSMDLTLLNAPDAFRTHFSDPPGAGVVLSAIPDGSGHATMSVTRVPGDIPESRRDAYLSKSARWTPLLAGVEKLRWMFFDLQTEKFSDDWTAVPPEVPAVMLEMTIPATGPIKSVFFIPRIVPPKEAALKPQEIPAEKTSPK